MIAQLLIGPWSTSHQVPFSAAGMQACGIGPQPSTSTHHDMKTEACSTTRCSFLPAELAPCHSSAAALHTASAWHFHPRLLYDPRL